MHSNKVLVSFKITKVENLYNTINLSFEKVKAASYYKVELLDSNANLIYTFKTNDTYNTFIVNNLKYNMNYSIMVYAYDKANNYVPAKNEYEFTYIYPTINKDNILLDNKEYKLTIDGNLQDKEYYLNITSNGESLINERIKDNEYILDSSLYLDKEKELNVELICDGVIIDKINLFNNMNPVKDIYIETPTNDTSILYNDISLIFNGGDNADHYSINLYKDDVLVNTTDTNKKKIVLSSSLFESNNNYRIDVVGVYGEYTNQASVNFTVVGLAKLKPVYINVNPKAVKKNTKIELKQPDGANIYYTLNGDDPTIDGILYENPIEIKESCTLKTVAISEFKTNSVVTTYNLNVTDKQNYKFYISPSNQGRNEGVHSTGFTTEKIEMNRIADYVIARLKQYDNVKVYRNNLDAGINIWNRDANYLGVDFKIAIHSNASVDHTAYGIETWIDNENSPTYSIASLLQDKMVELYPYKDRVGYNRGVKYSLGNLGEANDTLINFGLLIETAHHDDLLDAKWLKENQEEIGNSIAEVILKYFQII
jgi:N-acetylmuramoyl-L-alanine amidase